MSRPSLYKALSDRVKPQIGAVIKVLKATGGQINVKPISALKKSHHNSASYEK